MWISEPDEWQGLTPDMAQRYLDSKGWCNMPDPEIRLLKPQYVKVSFKMGLSAAVERIACIEGRTVQALLREINPRMRKGMPSDAALAEHDEWIVCTPFGATFIAEISYGGSDDGFSIMMPPINDHCDAEFIAEKHWPECLFWPCDKHGNKVRWPTDAEGKML